MSSRRYPDEFKIEVLKAIRDDRVERFLGRVTEIGRLPVVVEALLIAPATK